jgi:hypothetical protein
MTTPNQPGPVPDPSAYQPPSGAYPPAPGSVPTGGVPSGPGYLPPGALPPEPGAMPAAGYPADPGAYPPGGTYPAGAYPPGTYPPGVYPPPGAPGAPMPPGGVPPKKKSNTRLIVTLVIVAVVVVVGIVGYFVSRKSNPDNAQVGDCINYSSNTDVKIVDCGSQDAEYKVVKRVDGTSSTTACDNVADSDVSLYTEGGGKQYTLCVSLVLKKGDCISSGGDKVPCTDATAAFEVLSVLAGTQDDSGCPAESTGSRKYEGSNQVVCLKQTS